MSIIRYSKDMKRAAIYARVSTVARGQDPETQLRQLREYAERRGLPPETRGGNAHAIEGFREKLPRGQSATTAGAASPLVGCLPQTIGSDKFRKKFLCAS